MSAGHIVCIMSFRKIATYSFKPCNFHSQYVICLLRREFLLKWQPTGASGRKRDEKRKAVTALHNVSVETKMTTVVTEVRNTDSTCNVFMGRRSGKMAPLDGGQEVISRERKKQINGYTHGVGRWRRGEDGSDLIYEGARCRRALFVRLEMCRRSPPSL